MDPSVRNDRSSRPRRAGRLDAFKTRARSRPLLTLILANLIPIGLAVALSMAYARGTISFVPEASRVVPSVVLLGISLAVLVVLAWIVAPMLMPATRAASAFVNRQARQMAQGGPVGVILRAPLLVGGAAVYLVLWLNAALMGILLVIDVGAIVGGVLIFVYEVMRARP